MNREDYQKVKKIFQAALDIAPEGRADYLNEKCSDNTAVRREVEKLLDSFESGYLEQPAIEKFAEAVLGSNLSIGQEIGHYKIVKKIGAGGMGEVFLAEDARLKRKIALKILPAAVSQDKNHLRRFEQEACAASALNHPNILTVHEFGWENGTNFIASEFVKGKTLREWLGDDEPVHLPETLDIVLQVAAALHAAHESGIIHRDIKPENVMIREADGLVKVLDFGLAKLTLNKNEPISAEDVTQLNTAPGMVMGTAAYMSPEQTRGRMTDARSDIWSLGVVLYEMQTGKLPFKGETTSDTIASILMREPAPLDENMPAELHRILRKALQKNRDERYQTVKDFLLDLKTFKRELEFTPLSDTDDGKVFKETTRGKIAAPGDATSANLETTIENRSRLNTTPVMAARWRQSNRILITACALLIAFVGAAVVWKIISQNRNQTSSSLLASLRIKPVISWDSEAGESEAGARFSPNGTMIAYSLTKNGQRNIWTKQVPDGKPNPITDGKWNYYNPIWSPDGQRIAFVSNRDNQFAIWAMPFSGGELTLIKAVESNIINLLHWSKNGATIYYRERFNLFALDIASKQITQLTNFDETNKAQFFSLSPDEKRIAYASGPNEQLHIFVMDLNGGQPVQVTNDEASDEYPFWLPDGERIIYSSKRDGVFQTCIAYLKEHRSEQINLGISDTLISDVAPVGDKILFSQSREESDLWQVRIESKSETQITFDSGLELWSDASPDGKSIVFQAATESKHILEGSIMIRSTDDNQQIKIASNGFSPTFSPDGRRVAFLRYANNLINLWIVGRNGADERQLTTEDILFNFSTIPYNRIQVKDYSWSLDGGNLIYCAKKDGLWNVWQVVADGTNAPQQITNNTDENIRFSSPLFAPDGKHIAYTSSTIKVSSDAKKTTNIYLLDGENPKMIFSSESVFKLIGWERSGNNLIIAMTEDNLTAKPTKVGLVLVSPAGNNRTDLTSIESAFYNNIKLSPDGRRIAYAAHEDGKDNIWIISSAGGDSARITANIDPNVYVSGIAWSPDGKAIYYGKQKTVRMISMIENFK